MKNFRGQGSFITFENMGENNALAFFDLLKQEVEKTFLLKTSAPAKSIHEWTGNQIKDFQDDLANTLSERISERWFYMHLKPKFNEKLPRIDMLNILCKYTGYSSWEDFKQKNELQIESPKEPAKHSSLKGLIVLSSVIVLGMACVAFFLLNTNNEYAYTFCFYDKDTKTHLIDTTVEITVFSENESPQKYFSDSEGCIKIKTSEEFIHFVVSAPYYKTDTIERKLIPQAEAESIELKRDDYALMIVLFANSDVQDWEKRRRQLDEMISDEAIVFQISANNTGMEMYNKWEFIDKLTTPLRSLGAIRIVETIYEEEKIIRLRFMQQ